MTFHPASERSLTVTTATLLSLRDAPIETSTVPGGREYQQDAATWLRATEDPETGSLFLVAAVADGMGSGKDSDLIANDAVFLAATITAAHGPDNPDAAIRAAREIITVQHEDRGENDNSTLVLATVHDRVVRLAWVGDSRAYALDAGGRLRRLTTDHNRAPYAPNVLTRTLLGEPDHYCGGSDDCAGHTPETAVFDPWVGDGTAERVMLCTDGVCGVLDDNRIADILRSAPNANRAAKRLTGEAVRAATASGIRADNATALVIDLVDFRAEANK